ncbi:hypothetical protein HJFPF1_10388 [Paramyrothecium foliicola]|nr:hypothetical protein HJFPF1_10388 [Paramyrothecium foliicola]
MPSAIITGATGILGCKIFKELSSKPETWDTIYTVSRFQKEDFGDHVKHISLDSTAGAEKMASQLAGVSADYVLFTAYLQQDNEVEATRVNGDMLDAFCKALEINGVASQVKRF